MDGRVPTHRLLVGEVHITNASLKLDRSAVASEIGAAPPAAPYHHPSDGDCCGTGRVGRLPHKFNSRFGGRTKSQPCKECELPAVGMYGRLDLM